METNDRANAELQDKLTKTTPPMDMAVAERLLLEAKEIMDSLGVKFFLRQGTCLGAVRDNAFIPWDDDLDLGVILGSNGFTEQSIEPILAAFRESGYYVQTGRSNSVIYSTALKDNVRIDILFHQIIREQIYHWPGIWFPIRLFNPLKEITFLGETFAVPNPPEEYLGIKYGPNWRTPKRLGYAKDVVDNVLIEPALGFFPLAKRCLMGFLHPENVARLRVLDESGLPVYQANIRIVGLGSFKTDKLGYAKLYLQKDKYSPGEPTLGLGDPGAIYSIVIGYRGHEEVLYEEILAPTKLQVYRPDPAQTEGRIFVLSQQ
jgi:hypothetical protein